MSIMTRLGVRSIFLSVIEVAAFFALTTAYFVIPPKLYAPYISAKAARIDQAREAASQAAIAKATEEGESDEQIKKAGKEAADAAGTAIRSDKPMPIWIWVVLGAVYLMVVTVWWTPGDQKANNTELIALSIVACGGAILAAIIFRDQVAGIAKEFWDIMTTGGGRTG